MLLKNKNAVIYGAGGAIGGAVARTFAKEGAHVFLTGHSMISLQPVLQEIRSGGGYWARVAGRRCGCHGQEALAIRIFDIVKRQC